MGRRTRLLALVLVGTLAAVAACSSTSPGSGSTDRAGSTAAPPSTAGTSPGTARPAPSTASPPQTTSPATPPARSMSPPATRTTPPPAPDPAQRALARMSLAERVGQLFMVDCPSTSLAAGTATAITRHHVGSVILDGTSRRGARSTATLTAQLQRLAPSGVALFVATDQEGGLVQRLRGPGFDTIPSAVAQSGRSPAALRADARRWGGQLRAAGVNVNLAPVLDTVPAGFGSNPPIGDLDRQYGATPAAAAKYGLAFAAGMRAAGVDATVKHFPGLGRVHGNTDLTSGVRDTVTTRDDPYLAPFAAAVRARVPFVMMSTAIYTRIDPSRPAAFSKTIVTGMLRGDLGFRGVVISDDLGAAKQVGAYSWGERAVAFIAAGGDIVLTVDRDAIPAMTAAVIDKAKADTAFAKLVDAATLRVLRAKAARGLLG